MFLCINSNCKLSYCKFKRPIVITTGLSIFLLQTYRYAAIFSRFSES